MDGWDDLNRSGNDFLQATAPQVPPKSDRMTNRRLLTQQPRLQEFIPLAYPLPSKTNGCMPSGSAR